MSKRGSLSLWCLVLGKEGLIAQPLATSLEVSASHVVFIILKLSGMGGKGCPKIGDQKLKWFLLPCVSSPQAPGWMQLTLMKPSSSSFSLDRSPSCLKQWAVLVAGAVFSAEVAFGSKCNEERKDNPYQHRPCQARCMIQGVVADALGEFWEPHRCLACLTHGVAGRHLWSLSSAKRALSPRRSPGTRAQNSVGGPTWARDYLQVEYLNQRSTWEECPG